MGLVGALGVSLLLVSLTQVPHTIAQECSITSITASGPSSLLVKWTRYLGATNYLLDLRVVNSTAIAPVVVTLSASSTEHNVRGLRPGNLYSVTVKVFQFYYVMCRDTQLATTVPAASEITFSRALSSTSIQLEWARVSSSEHYVLVVESQTTGVTFNLTFSNYSAVVSGLQPSTAYDCYVYTANGAGLSRRSRVRTTSTLVQPPVGVRAEQTGKRSARVSWQPVENVLLYLVTVKDQGEPTRQPFQVNVSATHLDFQDVLPCSTYLISVSSLNEFLEPGEPTDFTYTTNTLTPVTSISVDYSCASGSAVVSWAGVFGADSYRAAAVDGNGTVLSCSTQSTQCQISGVSCGQRYMVHVTAMSESCESTANASTSFQTVPCAPSNLQLYRECSSNVIIFAWNHTDHTDYYKAKAVDSQGETMECMTTDNSCFFTDTVCGRRYTFTVYSVSGECNSPSSPPVHIRTAPCMPKNVRTSSDCQSDVLTSTWDRAEGALSYMVEAWGNKGDSYSCSSFTNSCAMPSVHCGEHLTIFITAYDDDCPSMRTLGQVAETVPCVPQNVSATMDCGTDSITVNWKMSHGALFYIGTAVDDAGVTHTCNSMDVSCQITGLRCGSTYTAFVTASNLKCNSSDSNRVTVETAACPPDHIEASLDCAANQALVEWQDQLDMLSYTATLTDPAGGLLSCSTTQNHCRVSSLKCGQRYAVSVSHHDGVCPSMPSKPLYMESVPCGPSNVQTEVDCVSGVLTVSWNATLRAEGYTTLVSDGTGEQVYCNSTEARCSLDTLECGVEYLVEVMSVNGTCLSLPSQTMLVREVPCVPSAVVTERRCGQSSVQVTWAASRGAKSYVAVAVGNHGHRSECSSNQTTCSLEELQCGQKYNVSVVAVDDSCSSTESAAVTLQTVPCPPSGLSVSVDCTSNDVSLSWETSPNAVSFLARALGSDGHNMSCEAAGSLGCQMEALRCGQEYRFTVSASDGSCHSPDSVEVTTMTAPCAPQSVDTTLNCSTNSLAVNWAPASIPVNYSATALAGDGTAFSCSSQVDSCVLESLPCGEEYSVTVAASSSMCQGSSSPPQTVHTVPCVPANLHTEVDCSSNTVQALWDESAGAHSYNVTLGGADGFSTSCSAANHGCSFPNLPCAQEYTLCVVAVDDQCSSSASQLVSVMTAPCDPENVTATLRCSDGVVTVTWEPSAGAHSYTVLAQPDGQQHMASCSSNSTSCELSQLGCGEVYTVTVLAGDGGCNSTTLATTTVETPPCPPEVLSHPLDCVSNHALVSWAEDEDAVGVVVRASSTMGHDTSCSSASNTSCLLDDLQCGHTYIVHAVAQGDQCDSVPSESFQIVTAPCTPAMVDSEYSCGTSMALLRWDETLGRENFYAHLVSQEHSTSCLTSQTTCSLSSLLCGQLYNVTVHALAGHCNCSQPATTQLHTAPCAPQNISVSLVCQDNTAEVSWLASPGAVGYDVMALGRDGDAKHCTSDTTNCSLPNMHCAQTYEITVTPFSDACRGFDSSTLTFVAGPCPPADVQVSLQCEGNVGSVSWLPAVAADLYVATATADDGHNHTCSSNSTGCSFSDLHCGENYVVTVITMERGCQSQPSEPLALRAALCPPTNVVGVTACGTNDITVSWDQSAGSVVTYVLHSQQEGGANASYSAAGTSHTMTGLQCGQTFAVTVTAQDSVCTSALSQTVHMDTAPCPPTSLAAQANCGTNKGTLTWGLSAGALTYTATVTGSHGHVASCSSNTTSCFVKLDCGHHYSALVVASNTACNSSMPGSIMFDSAPCLPGDVHADLDCSTNSFAVQWSESEGEVDNYSAIAIGSDGSRATCNTTSTACSITTLRCGLTYSIAVTTSSVNCGTIEGSDYQIQSAPCLPENPTVDVECSTNTAVVSWQNTGPDQLNVVTVVNRQLHTSTCNSSTSSCSFSSLGCGQEYTVTVVGHTEQCHSEASTSLRLLTAPCMPTHLTADVDCLTGITVVTWDQARGAAGYTVYALGSLGYNATCVNSDTMCDIPDLACGQDYNISVVPHHDTCLGMPSQTVTATTGPCLHSGLKSSLDCSSNTALVSWTPGSGIVSYNASVEGFDVSHHLTCSTEGSACNISSLLCGERYRVSVRGEGRTCPSPSRDWDTIYTAPCPPTQLSVESSCDSDTISVSWVSSQGSVSYKAVAESATGHRRACNTSSTSCHISGLLCGTEYQVYATGLDDDCDGAKSNVQVLHTAPCVPHDVQSEMDCLSGVLTVTWQQSGDAPHFHTTVQSSQGQVTVCDTVERRCVVPSMQCGLNYSVVVVAHDEACNSSHSPTQHLTAAPCPPDSFQTAVDCSSSVVMVTWADSAVGVVYTVSALDATGDRHSCNTSTGGCELSSLQCGTEYNVTITPCRDSCVGVDTPPQLVRTAPCVPVLSAVEMDCLSESAWVMWEKSAGAESYIVMAIDSHGQVQRFDCNSTDGMCAVSDMTCGQHLTFTLTARDWQCPSMPSNAVVTETAPCAPQDVQTVVGCQNRTVSVSWSPNYGALIYTATLERTDGKTTCCTTAETGCDITDLPCGEMYILVVTAEGQTCNSSQSFGVIVRTEPCVPQNLQASLSCGTNVASMSWNHSQGGQLYRVEAVGLDGHQDLCNSYENQCDLTGLHCGQHYTATVVAEDSDCTSTHSDSVDIKTVPCTPDSVSTHVDCEANSLSVSWSESAGATFYTATLQDSYGQGTTCQAMTEGSCNIAGLACGQTYHVSVVSSDGYCDSPPTEMVDTHSVPCEPTDIEAVFDCESRVVAVSWYLSEGAVSYVVSMTSVRSGHQLTCQTNETQCELGGVACGQRYTIFVQALGETCSSNATMVGTLLTDPCVPHHLTIQYSLTIGQVMWDVAPGADSYTVESVTQEGVVLSCSTNDNYCPIYNMACSQVYTVTVSAHNQACHGVVVSTQNVSVHTEPCPPNNIQSRVDCGSAVGTVSWEISFGAVGYMAYLDGRDGHSLSCHSLSTFCSVGGLHCGTIYYVRVVALGETLNSTDSSTVLLVSAPCPTADVVAELDCDNNTALVSWSWNNGAHSYLLTATGSDGHMASCETEENYCNVTELLCGQTYSLRLTAVNNHCQTDTDTGVSFTTRPCAPRRVAADLPCGTSTANLSWEPSAGAELYTATAVCTHNGPTMHCNSTEASCQVTELHCGGTYTLSVIAHSSTCQSLPSSTVDLQTEPCQPDRMTATGSCDSEMVMLAWSEAWGASAYVVRATGDLGYVTAFRTNETSLETSLPCGQTYNFTVTSQDDRCDSPASLPAELRTAPCVPQYVSSYTQCEDSLGSVSWALSDGADFYTAVAVGMDGHTHMCTTNTTMCTWDDLHCGDHYVIHVIANDYLCSSAPSNSTEIHMAPCVPQNMEAALDCSTKVVTMLWEASESAEFYVVTAETNSGHKVELSTNNTSTKMSEFLCGEEYFLSVWAGDSVCRSAPSSPARLKTEPCPPTNVSSSMDCVSNIAVVTWTASAGAEYYTATVTDDEGESESCMSASEQCGMPNLGCGQNYTVTVTASDQQCSSKPSQPGALQSVPCVPTDVVLAMDCSDNTVVVSWSASQGAMSYIAVAQSRQGSMASCHSTDLQCTLGNLTCGDSFFVQVVALDQVCSSLPSQAAEFHTVPCAPELGPVVLDCWTYSFLLEWSVSYTAQSYRATARSPGGHVSSCTTNRTNCELMELQCGQTYAVTVVASDGRCESFQSASVHVASVPCATESVVTSLDCSTNTALVEWSNSSGADSYSVLALGTEGHVVSCDTEHNACLLQDLMCSYTYNVSVVAVSNKCNVSESTVTQLHTVPCVPAQLDANVDCDSGAVSVSWEPSYGAVSYTAVAQGNGGYASSCNSSETSCQFSDLLCGLSYSVTVSAEDDTCRSAQSSALLVDTVPCVPQQVTAEMECSSDVGLVSWEQGEGVASYLVRAVGPDGHRTQCDSVAASCRLPSMHCGQRYNLTVTALDGRCDNSKAYLSLQTVPCSPTNLQASLQCRSNSVAVTWERASGAVSYQAVGVTTDGQHRVTCNNTVTNCDLRALYCGRSYNVSVFGQDEACSSMVSHMAVVQTAPCPPQDVLVDLQCSADVMAVSWAPNPDADSFHVSALSTTGAVLSCDSTSTGCSIHNLPCGQSYSVTVVTVRDGCESQSSDVVETSSAPCVPRNLEGSLDCVTNSAWVSWEASAGAQSYNILAQGVGGHNSSCTSSSSSCNVPDLECGTLYTFHVTASNSHCQSNLSTTFDLETGPCALTNITVVTECHSDSILVGWEMTEDSPLHLVTAEGHDQSFISCNSTSTSCVLHGARCGMHYAIIVSASSDKCSSLRSPPKKISTAPCVPEDVSVVASCAEEGVVVSWAPSVVAQFFLLTATGRDGDVHTCNTSVNNCTLGALHCGQPYSYSLTASDGTCTSQPSTPLSHRSGPCSPSGLSVEVQCANGSAVLSWAASEGAVEYLGYAQAEDGDMLYCDTADTSCSVQGLECGAVYNFSVQASDGTCNTSFSEPLEEGAAPCAPDTVSVRMQWIGQTQWVRVSWSEVYCPGVEYQVEVTGLFDDMLDRAATMLDLLEMKLRALLEWLKDLLERWRDLLERLNLLERLEDLLERLKDLLERLKNLLESRSSFQETLEDLLERLNDLLEELNDLLESLNDLLENLTDLSESLEDLLERLRDLLENMRDLLETLKNLLESLMNLSESWEGLLKNKYLVICLKHLMLLSYWTDRSYFELPLPCGTIYKVTVQSRNSAGVSQPSVVVTGTTAPCAPLNVSYSGDVELALLSWEASVFATSYTVYNRTEEGLVEVCNTTQLSCELTGVEPGTLEVTASNTVGESLLTTHITDPEVNRTRRSLGDLLDNQGLSTPVVTVTVDGKSLVVNWPLVSNADEYALMITEQGQGHSNVTTIIPVLDYQVPYIFTPVKLSTSYCVNVKAKSSLQYSKFSDTVCKTTKDS